MEPVQTADRSFFITPQQYELFKKRTDHKLQVRPAPSELQVGCGLFKLQYAVMQQTFMHCDFTKASPLTISNIEPIHPSLLGGRVILSCSRST